MSSTEANRWSDREQLPSRFHGSCSTIDVMRPEPKQRGPNKDTHTRSPSQARHVTAPSKRHDIGTHFILSRRSGVIRQRVAGGRLPEVRSTILISSIPSARCEKTPFRCPVRFATRSACATRLPRDVGLRRCPGHANRLLSGAFVQAIKKYRLSG